MIRRILLPACLVLLLGIPRGSLVAADCTAAAPCKILALHGGGGSANSMQANMAGLAESLGAAYTFVYASIGGPNVAEIWWEDPPGGKGQSDHRPGPRLGYGDRA